MKYSAYLLAAVASLFSACSHEYSPLHDATIRHASLLQMENLTDQRTLCRIANPWAPEQTAIQYLLVDKADSLFSDQDLHEVETRYGELQLLRTPLQRQALTTSCHAWLLHQLDALDGIAVMCDAEYVMDSVMQQRIGQGLIQGGGSSMSPNHEILLNTDCDAIWISPFENSAFSGLNSRFQIPEIYCADYMETSPLARAEWIRFYGRLVDRTAEADSLFSVVESRYDSIAHLADSVSSGTDIERPTLLCELPYSGTWFVAGGQSTLGLMYQDAGFRYPWESDRHAGSLALSPEAVFDAAGEADIWIIKYNNPTADITLAELLEQHPFFPQIKAARVQNVFGCNSARNDYFDVTPFRPDWLLEELFNLAQNNLEELRFFKLLAPNP